MENFIIAVNLVLPLFFLIGLGYFLKRVGWVTELSLREWNGLVFKIFLPVLLFGNMYEMDTSAELDFFLMAFAAGTVLILFLFLCGIMSKVEKDRKKRATLIQGLYRSNFALFGIAITESMYGQGNAGITGILVAFIVPLFNVLAVGLFEWAGCGSIRIGKMLGGIGKNPLIIGTLAGLIAKLCRIPIPLAVQSSIHTIGGLATPIALIVLGGTLTFQKMAQNRKKMIGIVAGRLFLIPAVLTFFSILLGFRGKELFALYVMFGSPTAVASFSMAGAMGGDRELAGQIVIATTVCSLFSCIIFLFFLQKMAVL